VTADELITAVRDFANLSASAEDAQSAQILRRLNLEQTLFLTTILEKAKGQHRQTTLDITTSASTLRYFLPSRAIAAGIKMLAGVDSAGNQWMLYDYSDETNARFGRWWAQNGHFYIEGNELVFYQSPPAGTLRVTYSRRLSELVLTTSAAVITSISGGTIGIAAAPTTGTGFTAGGAYYDFVKVNPHFDILAMDKSATRSSTTMTFSASDIPSSLAVGDYVALAKQTPVCQAPLELHPLLALRTAYAWSRAKNDPIANVLEGDLKEATAHAATLLEPRIEQEGPLVNRWAPGWGRWPWFRRVS
jgi:hypothetical protein